jgi:NADH-quinone oxidoreductase subunit H
VCAMVTTLFFGGWDIPFTHWDEAGGVLQSIATAGFFFVKVMFWIFFVMWIRWTLPRFRYDQLMSLGWKVLLPLSLAYIMVVCVAIYVVEHVLGLTDPILKGLSLFALSVVVSILVFGVLDRGVFVRGSGRQRRALNAPARRAPVVT